MGRKKAWRLCGRGEDGTAEAPGGEGKSEGEGCYERGSHSLLVKGKGREERGYVHVEEWV